MRGMTDTVRPAGPEGQADGAGQKAGGLDGIASAPVLSTSGALPLRAFPCPSGCCATKHMHAYIRVYIHAYIHTYVHTCIHTYIQTYIYIHTHTNTNARTHTHTCVCVYVCVCVSIHDVGLEVLADQAVQQSSSKGAGVGEMVEGAKGGARRRDNAGFGGEGDPSMTSLQGISTPVVTHVSISMQASLGARARDNTRVLM